MQARARGSHVRPARTACQLVHLNYLDIKEPPHPELAGGAVLRSWKSKQIGIWDDAVVDDSHVMVSWKHPYRRRTETAWFPATQGTELDTLFREHQHLSWTQRLLIRGPRRLLAGPGGSSEFGAKDAGDC